MVIDDRLLRSWLLDDVTPQISSLLGDVPIFTTSTWLYRLTQTVRSDVPAPATFTSRYVRALAVRSAYVERTASD
jgi:hypothetical protein